MISTPGHRVSKRRQRANFSNLKDISVEIDEIKLVNGGITFNTRAAV
jgi:hypothetical protein